MNGHVDVLETADQLTGHGPWVGEVLIKDRRDLGPDLVTITWTAWLRTTAAAFLVGVRLAVTWQWDVGIQLMKPEGVLEQRGPGSGRLSPGHLGHRRTEDSILLIMSLSMPSRHSPQQGSLGILLHPNATIRRHRHRKLPLKDLDDLFVPDDDAVRVGEDGFEVGVRVGGGGAVAIERATGQHIDLDDPQQVPLDDHFAFKLFQVAPTPGFPT